MGRVRGALHPRQGEVDSGVREERREGERNAAGPGSGVQRRSSRGSRRRHHASPQRGSGSAGQPEEPGGRPGRAPGSSSDHWGFEDPIYRFYHQSLEVYDLQAQTREMVRVLEALAPGRTLHPGFLEIIEEGTGRDFEPGHNADWARITRPIVEAFLHARYFLEMAVRYAHLEEPPSPLPSGYAALLELYGLR